MVNETNTLLPSYDNALQTTLLAIYQELTLPLELEELVERFLNHSLTLFQSDGVAVGLLDENKLMGLSMQPERTMPPLFFGSQIPPYLKGQGAGGYALQVGHVVATNDYWQDDRFERDEWLDNLVRQGGMVSIMVSPIRLQGEDKALLWLTKAEPYCWSLLDLARLEQMVAVFGLALYNARQNALLAELANQTELHHRELIEVKKAAEKVLNSLRSATRELSQPVILLQMELELLAQLKTPPEPEVFERMRKALERIVSLMRLYQKMPSSRI